MALAQAPSAARKRGRPPSAAAHRAVLNAARELLAQRDLSHLNLEQVAEQAGVSKATLYRHWPTREALALEVLAELTGHLAAPDRGNTRLKLIAMVESTLRIMTETPLGAVLQGMFSDLARNPAIRDAFRARVVASRRAAVGQAMQRGVRRGDIRSDADVDLATELLVGPIYYRMLFGGPLPPEFAERIVDAVLVGYTPRIA